VVLAFRPGTTTAHSLDDLIESAPNLYGAAAPGAAHHLLSTAPHSAGRQSHGGSSTPKISWRQLPAIWRDAGEQDRDEHGQEAHHTKAPARHRCW